jgi:hypothetical protein
MTTPITLFDLPEPLFPHTAPTDPRPEQLKTMHGDYGLTPGQTCGGCVHCALRPGNKRSYYKCTLFGRYTSGPGTDWRKKWPACGGWLGNAEHPLPEHWVLQRAPDGRWQASDGFHATPLHTRREDAIAAAQQAVARWKTEGKP